MWLQTPLVCCTVDHMFTLKRISGVSPSGAEINANSWVQIFLSPRCWKAQSQSRGLGQLLWAVQLNWVLTDPGSVWHRAAHASGQRTGRTSHTHVRTHPHHWWCLQPLCVLTHLQKWLCYSLWLWSATSQSHSQCLLLFSHETASEARKVWNFIYTLNYTHILWKRENTSPSHSLSTRPGVVLKQPGIILCFYRKVFWMLCSFPHSVRGIGPCAV